MKETILTESAKKQVRLMNIAAIKELKSLAVEIQRLPWDCKKDCKSSTCYSELIRIKNKIAGGVE